MSGTQGPTLPVRADEGRYVLFLDDIDYAHLPSVGGKGANLGELTRAGFPVPPGFCITTDAYAQIAERADLTASLAELAGAAGQAESAQIAAAIRERLLRAPFPQDLADAVRAAYRSLGVGTPIAVAVRSSATAEDLPFASFAGQQETYLNVVGEDALLDAVRRCWSSLWTERAVSYRTSNQIDPRQVRLAVVVQALLDVAQAGVLFTANPLTGRRRQAVIDASAGLGEAVVSGAVNPDHFVVDTASGAIVERRLGDKRVVIAAVPGGGTRRIERAGQSEHASLGDEQIRALAQLGARIEVHYQAPQDIEWAIDTAGKLWLTQARPITTLYPLPAGAPRTDDVLRVYFSVNVAQGVYQPFTPMGIAAVYLLASAAARLAGAHPRVDPGSREARPGFLVEAGMRLFADITGAMRNPIGRRMLNFMLPFAEARAAVLVRALEADPRLRVSRGGRWRVIRGLIAAARRLHLPRYLLQALLRPGAARRRVLRVRQRLERILTIPPGATSLQRLDLIETRAPAAMMRVVGSLAPVMAAGFGAFGLAGKLLGNLATADERQTVLRGLPANPTTQMDLALWGVAREIAADPDAAALLLESPLGWLVRAYRLGELPPVAQRSLAEFLRTYGHRGVAEIDMGLARWSDDPTHILGVLVNYLRLDDTGLAPDVQFARGAQQADAMVRELARRARRRGRLRGRLVNVCLRRTRQLVGMREMPKFYLVWMLARMRDILRPVADELVGAGRVEQADDLYFLTFADVRTALAGADMRHMVRERRATYAREMQRRHVPRILLSDGSEPTAAAASDDPDALRGTPASAGIVTAKARVIHDPVGAHLEPGEILVAPSTDPGWTPLFLTAGGLVMEMGGSVSHGAVVAREYGIPAVVGVAGATERIQSGQTITVDGSTGTIALRDANTNERR
jgi:pyruvate,water dikinase